MTYRVVVWGTGNAGRPAIRAVAAHADLELVGVVVSNPAKVGKDAGELAFIEPLGVAATDDPSVATGGDVDAVVYTATADTRPDEAFADLLACLESGANVLSTSFYPLLHPASGVNPANSGSNATPNGASTTLSIWIRPFSIRTTGNPSGCAA